MSELFPAKSIAVEVMSCTDQARISEFNRWYDTVHLRTLRDTPGIVDVYRYRDMQPDLGELAGARFAAPEGRPVRYVTLYRINAEDPWAVMRTVKEDDKRKAAEGRMIDCIETYELTVWDFAAYRRSILPPVRSETRMPDGMPEVVLLVHGGLDLEHRVEHDDWWLYTHAHDLLETPGMVQCERYRNLNPRPAEDESQFLHIYEFDADDPVSAFRRILEDDLNVRRVQGRFSSYSRPAKAYGNGLYQHWDLM